MYIGLQFPEEEGGTLALVHKKWITPRKSEVWWPPYKKQETYDRALKKGYSPEESWQLYKIERCFFEEDDFTRAKSKLKKAEVTSDLQTDDEIPEKRRRLPPKRLSFENDESDINEIDDQQPLSGIASLLTKRKVAEQNSVNKTSREHLSVESAPTTSITGVTPTNENNEFIKKIFSLLVQIKNQNTEICALLKEHNKTNSELITQLPSNLPVTFPLKTVRDIRILEEYLTDEARASELVSYCAILGGRDRTTKTNNIMRHLLGNQVASEYSFFGSRNGKTAFKDLRLKRIIVGAVLKGNNDLSELDVENAIKTWLKHAPRRHFLEQKKSHAESIN